MNALEQLGQLSTLVADSGDLDAIRRFKPTDATTNPSLILAAASTDHAATWAREALVASGGNIDRAREKLTVRFGCEILKSVGRYVSTEVDPRASFDTQKTIQAAERIIADYAAAEVGPERVLIKIASTWEGIRAARVLHHRMLVAVLGSPLSFFDTTPIGRVINRFSSDLQMVDVQLRMSTQMLFMSSFAIVGALAAIALSSPLVLLAAALYRSTVVDDPDRQRAIRAPIARFLSQLRALLLGPRDVPEKRLEMKLSAM